jgi:phage terminase small subunit
MERRRRFIEAYIATVYCGARAARLAGCPPAGARVAACRMLGERGVKTVLDEHFRQQEQAWRRLFC